jgi:hypothetical protein
MFVHAYKIKYILFFVVLGLEPKVLYMLGKCSNTELHPQPLVFFGGLLLFFCSTWVWTQHFVLPRQALYHLSHAPSPSPRFWERISQCSSGWPGIWALPTCSDSWVLGLQACTTKPEHWISFSVGTWIWTQGFMLPKEMLYRPSHTCSPFCSGYSGDGGLAQIGLKPRPSWSQPPKHLALQGWVTSTWLKLLINQYKSKFGFRAYKYLKSLKKI